MISGTPKNEYKVTYNSDGATNNYVSGKSVYVTKFSLPIADTSTNNGVVDQYQFTYTMQNYNAINVSITGGGGGDANNGNIIYLFTQNRDDNPILINNNDNLGFYITPTTLENVGNNGFTCYAYQNNLPNGYLNITVEEIFL
tara:strand:- start:209 stop:634 length:426 start_codon:yes stop_codon:yes gene_type:complete